MNHNNKSAVTVLRWAARLASLASLGLILILVIGEGFNPLKMTTRDLALGVFFPFGICMGMILAWWRAGWGGCVTVASAFAFYAAHFAVSGTMPRGPWFVIVASPGALFLLSSLVARRRGDAAARVA